jgi:hypothetical protein
VNNPSNDGKAGDWGDNGFEGKEIVEFVVGNIVKWQHHNPVDEVADHETGSDVGRFWEMVWDVPKSRPDGKDHRLDALCAGVGSNSVPEYAEISLA